MLRTLLTTAMLAGLCTGGCGANEGALGSTTTVAPPISWEEFRSSARQRARGGFVVDGDIPLANETELREYYDSWSPPGALTVSQVFGTGVDNLWPGSARMKLSYCIGSSTGANKSAVVSAMRAATQSWSRFLGVQFVYASAQDATCSASNNSVTFDVQEVAGGGYADSFFPHQARNQRTLEIRPSAYSTTEGGRDFEGILRHELGHALGFRHEHIWLDDACHTEPITGNGQTARLVNVYDVNSVMHYPGCRPSESGGYRQSYHDYQGGVSLYGLAVPLINVATL